jgi:Cys-rich repeat protein
VNAARALLLSCVLLAACDEQLRFEEPAEVSEGGRSAGCTSDGDCGAAALHCDRVLGECVACIADHDCDDPAAPRCDSALHRCVGCGSDLDCADNETCVPRTRTCVTRCAEGATEHVCPDSAPTCDEVARLCVQCKSDQDCRAITDDGDYCETDSGRCVHCTDDRQCPATQPRCDQVQHRCAQCSTNRDCPAGLACDPATLRCL